MVAKKPRVVIVGAGMSGLTAAHRLHTATAGGLFDLTLLEAGDRIGGRVLTSSFCGDQVEMGATWIHGIEGSPIHSLGQSILALQNNQSQPWERMDGFPENPLTLSESSAQVVDDRTLVAPITALYRRLMDSARAGDAPRSGGVGSFLRQGLEAYRAARSGGSGDDRDLAAVEDAVFAIGENTERTCTSADDLDDLDLAAEAEYRDFPGDQITIARGYSRIIEALAAALPAGAIRHGAAVRRIEWSGPDGGGGGGGTDGGPVRIQLGDGSAVAADHVIVTVSLGILKAGLKKAVDPASGLTFSPGLPTFKKEAIGRLGFGVVNKLFLEMDGPDFPFLQLAFDHGGTRQAAKIPRWMRRTASICPIYGGSRVALAWLAGEDAMEMEGLDDDQVVSGVHATLDAFSGGEAGRRCNGCAAPAAWRVRRVKRSAWGTDPLFLGSYSYVAVGSSGDDLDLMAEPLPRRSGGGAPGCAAPLQILFAGEATHRTHYSTTHGAYFSGIREANRLLQHYHCSNGAS